MTDPSNQPPAPSRPSLRRELLVGLSLLAAGAISFAVIAALLAQYAETEPALAVMILVLLIVADIAIVALFGRHLVERLIVRPMDALTGAAREIGAGNLERRAPEAETREFTQLAEQFNQMTERLLDARGELIRVEKLAGIGRLAAGIAHEVGNPLSAIGTYAEVLRKRGTDPEILTALARETERIDRIVRGLLAYARPREEAADEIDLAGVLKSALDLLTQQGALKGITVRVDPGDTVPPPRVRGKFHELEQVAVNLLLNAADAAPGGTMAAGVIAWTYEPGADPPRRRSEPHPYPRPARPSGRRPFRPELVSGTPGAVLYVADSGAGVPVADRERVFDPFFTTKPLGVGTGLGLAIVQRTVHELGGVVWVDDAREGGAAFKVFLPAAERRTGEAAEGPGDAPPKPRAGGLPAGKEVP